MSEETRKKYSPKWNLFSVFIIATAGNLFPLFRELYNAGGVFSDVSPLYYYLIAMSVIGFSIAYYIVNKLAISKKTDSFYLSLLGVNFLVTIILLLFISVLLAIVY